MVRTVPNYEYFTGLKAKVYAGHAVSLDKDEAKLSDETLAVLSSRGYSHTKRAEFLERNSDRISLLSGDARESIARSIEMYTNHLKAYAKKTSNNYDQPLQTAESLISSLREREVVVLDTETGAEETFSPSVNSSTNDKNSLLYRVGRKIGKPTSLVAAAVLAGTAGLAVYALGAVDPDRSESEVVDSYNAESGLESILPQASVMDENFDELILPKVSDNVTKDYDLGKAEVIEIDLGKYPTLSMFDRLAEINQKLREENEHRELIARSMVDQMNLLEEINYTLEYANERLTEEVSLLRPGQPILPRGDSIIVSHVAANLPAIGPIFYADTNDTGLDPVKPIPYSGDNFIDSVSELGDVAIASSITYPHADSDSWERFATHIGLSVGEAEDLEQKVGGNLDSLVELFVRMQNSPDGVVVIPLDGKERLIANSLDQINRRRR